MTGTGLTTGDFPAFFCAVRGHAPFPWQERLVDEIAPTGRWPALLDLPTGTGKTAALDIAVFLLALDADQGRCRMPRRIALVVDRRVVVDQAAEVGQALSDALADPDAQGIIARVGDALRRLSGSGTPLITTALRGGIVRDERWAERPDVPAVLSATVDQIGSRLLFRGYGLSQSMRPVHAGLLGTDTLVLLDEVHLARPFAQTLRALANRHRSTAERPLDPRWQVVEMSATPERHWAATFGLADDDRDPGCAPVLARRLEASKRTDLAKPVAGTGSDYRALAVACARVAGRLVDREGVRTVGVIVNRVATAHAIAQRLREGDFPTLLVTGRMRPLERDRLLSGHYARLRTGRERRDDDAPLVVVGTQCIEAGADFDFDALVSECASLDALRQRFGRLDRDGRLCEAGHPAPGVIVVRKADILTGADDPVYGPALEATWRWLSERETVDFGHGRLPEPDGESRDLLLAPKLDAPVLLPAHLDAWVQTAPAPTPEPDVATWLHGMRPASSDVSVIWRAELSEEWLRRAAGSRRVASEVVAALTACPPGATEATTIPIGAARRWLAREGGSAVLADVEGRAESDPSGEVEFTRPFAIWRGEDSAVTLDARTVRPGDVVVVPRDYGGLAHGSWDPTATEAVVDLGHEAQRARRRRALRLLPELWSPLVPPSPPKDEDGIEPDHQVVRRWLSEQAGGLPGAGAALATELLAGKGLRVSRLPVAQGSIFVCWAWAPVAAWAASSVGTESEPETSSFTAQEVALAEHLRGVGETAAAFAERCGLDSRLVLDLGLAGHLHDLGKLDPRFQLMLHQGSELRLAAADGPLAKSALPAGDRRARQRARDRSGYPPGQRHELLSTALIETAAPLAQRAHDWELVVHLISSHHGHCRPFAPIEVDAAPQHVRWEHDGIDLEATTGHELARLDRGVPDRFWRLVDRYGWFGLAWLEALLRLADHHVSAQEQAKVVAG